MNPLWAKRQAAPQPVIATRQQLIAQPLRCNHVKQALQPHTKLNPPSKYHPIIRLLS
jgi:hypothetical protein